jgi:DNA primase
MGYNTSGGFANCWKCGSHSVFAVIREYTGLAYDKTKKLVEQLDDLVAVPPRKATKAFLSVPACVNPLKNAHIRYLTKRGFHYKTIQQLWQVRGIGVAGRLAWRLFIPILHKGRMVSWTTRTIGNKGLRYISAEPEHESIPHKHILYGMDYVRHTAIIVEGPLDAWAVGPGAVATFGTAYTKHQIAELINVPKRIICYDNNPGAQRQATKLLNELGPFEGETINVVLDADDPGEAKSSELRKLRKFLE